MVQALPNLRVFGGIGKRLAVPAWNEYHSSGNGIESNPNLRCINLRLRHDEDIDSDDHQVLINLAKFQNLKEIMLYLNDSPLPYPTEAAYDSTGQVTNLIPDGTFNVETLLLEAVDFYGKEFNSLIPAFGLLRSLVVEIDDADSNFSKDVALLPKTLEVLKISIVQGDPEAINFDNVVSNFPDLHVLQFSGQIYTQAIFPHIALLSKVTCLHFKGPSTLYAREILSLMHGSNKMLSLGHVDLDIGFTVLRPGGVPRPMWTEDFGKKEARKIVQVGAKYKMSVTGSIICALKLCGACSGCAFTRG